MKVIVQNIKNLSALFFGEYFFIIWLKRSKEQYQNKLKILKPIQYVIIFFSKTWAWKNS